MSHKAHWIGFDRRIELSWLDFAAARVAQGATEQDVRQDLLDFLQSLSHDPHESGSARPKTARVILRIWGGSDSHLVSFAESCLRLLETATPSERLALHWAVTMAAYQYFFSHARVIGRVLGLQETISAEQIRKRIKEQWGDRSTVYRTSRYVVRSMVAWGALAECGKGVYSKRPSPHFVTAPVALKLIRAVLYNMSSRAMPLTQLVRHPALFPFEFGLDVADVSRTEGLDVTQEGVGTLMVRLRPDGVGP